MDESGDGFVSLEEFIGAMGTVEELRHAGDIFKWKRMFEKYVLLPRTLNKYIISASHKQARQV